MHLKLNYEEQCRHDALVHHVVRRALAEPSPEAMTRELAGEVGRRAAPKVRRPPNWPAGPCPFPGRGSVQSCGLWPARPGANWRARPMAKRRQPRTLVSLRLDPDLLERVDAQLEALAIDLDRSALLRECLRLGLRQVERDPGCLVRPVPREEARRSRP